MLRKTLLFLCLCYQLTNFIVGAEDPEGECYECTIKMESAMEDIRDAVAKEEPFKLQGLMPPCSECVVRGLSSIIVAEGDEACSYPPDSNGETRFAFKFTLPTFSIECKCQLPCNPMKIIENFVQPATAGCQPEETEAGAKTSLSGAYPAVNGGDVAKLTQCAAVVGGNAECTDDQTVNDTILLTWSNKKFTINSWANSDGVVYRTSDLVIDKFDADSATCVTNDQQFKRSCDCLLATHFVRNTLIAALAVVSQCSIDTSSRRFDSLLYDLKC